LKSIASAPGKIILFGEHFVVHGTKAILAGDNIFLSFKVEESPNENLYFQLLNLDLSLNGNPIALADPSTSKQGFDITFGEDAYIYYAYSENYDISIKKIRHPLTR